MVGSQISDGCKNERLVKNNIQVKKLQRRHILSTPIHIALTPQTKSGGLFTDRRSF